MNQVKNCQIKNVSNAEAGYDVPNTYYVNARQIE